jgi:hypothetical protein
MPLYVPPALLNEAEAARHQEIWKERDEAIKNGQYERDTELADEQSRLGTFRALFLHNKYSSDCCLKGQVLRAPSARSARNSHSTIINSHAAAVAVSNSV